MTAFSDTQVLVTGGGGFIGGHLVARLVREGALVRAFVRYNSRNDRGALEWFEPAVRDAVEVVSGDLRDIESVERATVDAEVVFHLGALIAIPYSYVNPRDYVETNIVGSLNVAQAALRTGVQRVVHTSTSEVYGTAQFAPITEQHPLNGQSPYAATKIGADQLMDSFHRTFDLPVVVLRPFNTFGPHQSARAVIPTIISQALAGGVVRLGSLTPRRDLTYVDDTVEGFLAAARAEHAVGRTVQLGTGVEVTVGDIVNLVGELLDRELDIEVEDVRVRPEKSEVGRLLADPSLAAELLDWRSRLPLREGLERTISWAQANQVRFRSDQYVV